MIDLHLHSTASDGTDPPNSVVAIAAANGCTTIAITDHDTLAGVAPAQEAGIKLGVQVISAVEVSVKARTGSIHCLVYFVQVDSPLGLELVQLRGFREDRNREIIDRMRSDGLDVDYETIRSQAATDNLGRPHFATYLMKTGMVASVQEAFDRYLGKGQRYYVSKSQLDSSQLIELARISGSVVSLAHPFRDMDSYGGQLRPQHQMDAARKLVKDLASVGYQAVETYYSMHTLQESNFLLHLCDEFGLIPTGGSDYHGSIKPGLQPGMRSNGEPLGIPNDVVDRLVRARDALL